MPSANRSSTPYAAPLAVAVILAALAAGGAAGQESYATWEVLQSTFESTGGGGIIIKEYNPVIVGAKCVTRFTATEPGPGGKVYFNIVEFDAVATQGGTLCADGRWRAIDGSDNGTTPLRVFIKDGITRRSP